jgi:hypothetical protein
MSYRINSIVIQLVAGMLFISCAAFQGTPLTELKSGYYSLKEDQEKNQKVFLKTIDDSVVVYVDNKIREKPLNGKAQLIQKSFDVDIITFPFKYRPSTAGFPRQLSADFNGNVYLGYRIDRFYKTDKPTPAGVQKTIKHRALTTGLFGGVGSTFVSPWTTNYRTTDEYNAPVLSRGLVLMAGINSLTVGVGVGWDYLTDRDKSIWIYQNRPWYGVAIGLSIN